MPPVDLPRALRAASAGDRIGMLGSVVCALHCALVPVLISLLPALGLGLFASADLDQGFAVFAGVLGVATLSVGFRRHRAFHAWALLLPGLALIWAGSFTELHDHSLAHVSMMVVGGLLVAGAHLLNLRLTHGFAAQMLSRQTESEPA